jgi:hypothetical protein
MMIEADQILPARFYVEHAAATLCEIEGAWQGSN